MAEVNKLENPCKNVQEVCQHAYAKKDWLMIDWFPSVNKTCKLLFSTPVSVGKDERAFSKMKIVKSFFEIHKSQWATSD
jgi:hypothetical protein